MADKKTSDQPSTDQPSEPQQQASAANLSAVKPNQADPKDVPLNAREDTEAAAEKATQVSQSRAFTPSVEKGSDKAFNAWMRKAHEQGNPEQITPMQAEQSYRDMATDTPTIARHHDLNDPDTRWVVENVLGEDIPPELDPQQKK